MKKKKKSTYDMLDAVAGLWLLYRSGILHKMLEIMREAEKKKKVDEK